MARLFVDRQLSLHVIQFAPETRLLGETCFNLSRFRAKGEEPTLLLLPMCIPRPVIHFGCLINHT